jgi:predicted nucleic acid-binding protein
MSRVLIDTGPLVALLNRADRHHDWIREVLDTIEPPVFSCEAVVSEACFLLSRVRDGQDAVLGLLANDILKLEFRLSSEVDAVRGLMNKFASVPMSFADACLVRMSELEPRSRILTLDSDFRVYRRNRRQAIPTIMPGRESGG